MKEIIESKDVSIKEPKIKKTKKLKKVCFKCHTFDGSLHGSLPRYKSYKCAVPGFCPGVDWSESKKRRVIQRNGRRS